MSEPTFDPQLVAEFTRRGISERKANELLTNLKPRQELNLVAKLEHAEYLVQHSQTPITNPAGFIIRLIQYNTPVPDHFETSAKRQAREERERSERERRSAEDAQEQLELEYEKYCDAEVDRFIAANPATFEAIKDAKRRDGARFNFYTDSTANIEARYEIRKQLSLPSLAEFTAEKQQVPEEPNCNALIPLKPPSPRMS